MGASEFSCRIMNELTSDDIYTLHEIKQLLELIDDRQKVISVDDYKLSRRATDIVGCAIREYFTGEKQYREEYSHG